MSSMEAWRLRVSGHVQGVGFRPFVYRLAQERSLCGTVQNLHGEVEILVQGAPCDIERFCRDLTGRAPPLARPRLSARVPVEAVSHDDFRILESATGGEARVSVPPDSFVCEACLAELADPAGRRHRHPFINCTQCGPRYTVIEALPYDRARTTLAGFALCPECLGEYLEPQDRRFHAEPIACRRCGPVAWLTEEGGSRQEGERALSRAVELLHAGAVLAVKGVGGYHLLCDATSRTAVERLRTAKRRPDKPFAVMFPEQGAEGLELVRGQVLLEPAEARLLSSPARPIVLVRRRRDATLACGIAPGLLEIGALLPYSPLHHLLLGDFGRPVVATSGNLSGEPVQTDPRVAQQVFTSLADACLHHDRPIARPADDSVMRVSHGRARTVRVGRGLGPLELPLPARLSRPVLAVGGHLKTCIALGFEDRVVISPHIGDMGTVRSEEVFMQLVQDLQRLYGVAAQEVICDAHPGYATSRWARGCGLPVTRVWHHHAHAASLAADHEAASRPEQGATPSQGATLLVFAWDGTGLGQDGTLWGGEALLGGPGDWRRVASLRPFRLPGGERAARAPWVSAAALCWELGLEPSGLRVDPLVQAAWRHGINCQESSSAGRLFDTAAALLLGLRETSHEGQGAMQLEALATEALEQSDAAAQCALEHNCLPGGHDSAGLLRLDWEPLIAMLRDGALSVAERAWRVHAMLAASIVHIAVEQRRAHGVRQVGLTGGVFQNRLLTRLAHERLVRAGFSVRLAERVPCNDGGLSHGQVIERLARQCRSQELKAP